MGLRLDRVGVPIAGGDALRTAWLWRVGAMGNVQLAMLGRRAFDGAVPIVEAAEPAGSRGRARGHDGAPAGLGASSASADPPASELTVEATVKWFSAEKGYGFVELAGGRADAFLHLKTLRQVGRDTLPSGAKVRA